MTAELDTAPRSAATRRSTIAGRTLAAGETWVFGALVILIVVFTIGAGTKFLSINNLSLTAWLIPLYTNRSQSHAKASRFAAKKL